MLQNNLDKHGKSKGIEIYPGQKSAGISFTLPIDKVITSARLDLYVSMTEAMQGNTNHIDVKVNGQALGSLPVAKTEITNYELDIPAEYLAQEIHSHLKWLMRNLFVRLIILASKRS